MYINKFIALELDSLSNINWTPAGTAITYFIHARGTDYIKIGVTSDMSNRLQSLKTGNPYDLVVLGWYFHVEEPERLFHTKYKDININREWFKCDNDLLVDVISANNWASDRELMHYGLF